MERPVELIQRIAESGWEDGGLYSDELNAYFDQWDDEQLTSQQVADQEAARVVELEKQHAALMLKLEKLEAMNYRLIMNGGAVTSDDGEEEGGEALEDNDPSTPEPEPEEVEEIKDIDDLNLSEGEDDEEEKED